MWYSAVGCIVTLTLSLLAALLTAEAQQATKVHRVGRLFGAGSPSSGPDPSFEAFRQGLHDLGYVEGQNLVIEYRYAEGKSDRLPDLAADLVRLKVDVIVASVLPDAMAAFGTATHAIASNPAIPMASHARIRRLCVRKPVSFVGLRG